MDRGALGPGLRALGVAAPYSPSEYYARCLRVIQRRGPSRTRFHLPTWSDLLCASDVSCPSRAGGTGARRLLAKFSGPASGGRTTFGEPSRWPSRGNTSAGSPTRTSCLALRRSPSKRARQRTLAKDRMSALPRRAHAPQGATGLKVARVKGFRTFTLSARLGERERLGPYRLNPLVEVERRNADSCRAFDAHFAARGSPRPRSSEGWGFSSLQSI